MSVTAVFTEKRKFAGQSQNIHMIHTIILPGTITVFYCSSAVHLAAQVEQLGLSVSLKSTLIVVVEAINSFTFFFPPPAVIFPAVLGI